MIIIKLTVSVLHIQEGTNLGQRDFGNYSWEEDEKYIAFRRKYRLTRSEAGPWGKWYPLYLMLCAEGLL